MWLFFQIASVVAIWLEFDNKEECKQREQRKENAEHIDKEENFNTTSLEKYYNQMLCMEKERGPF